MTKPDPAIYHKAIELLGHKPEECLMVAAHAYDLEAAKKMYGRALLQQDSFTMMLTSQQWYADCLHPTLD